MTTKKTPKKRKKPETVKQKTAAGRLAWVEDIVGFWIILIDENGRIPIRVFNSKESDLIARLKKTIEKE